MKIVHVITGLNQGGAENALVRLVSQSFNSNTVISLTDEGAYGAELRASGIPVLALNSRSYWFSISSLKCLRNLIREEKPDVVQTWMYHADLLGGIVGKNLGIPVVWGIRTADQSMRHCGFKTWVVAKLCAILSSVIPYCIVSCSQRAIALQRHFGYADRFVHIPNGFDTNGVNNLNKSYCVHIPAVFGHAARLHSIKGHSVFLAALAMLKSRNQQFRARMCGTNISYNNPDFAAMVPMCVRENIDAIGCQKDLRGFYASCDVFILSSFSESFPNVVAEAMLQGLPCIVTDVGDAPEIVGDTGWVVPPNDVSALADAMQIALTAMSHPEAWVARKKRACERILNNYSIDNMTALFEKTWTSAMEK